MVTIRKEIRKIINEVSVHEENYNIEYILYEAFFANEQKYGIDIIMIKDNKIYDQSFVNPFTTSKIFASELFEIIVKNDVFPCTLRDIIYDEILMRFENLNYR